MRISKKAILEGLRALYPDAGPELHFRNAKQEETT